MKKPKIKKKVKEDRPCKLCGNVTELKESHIIPKFVFKWIKNTSKTKRFRSLKNPNKPLQDGNKENLLCLSCEERFNKYETWFSSTFFHASTSSPTLFYKYDEKLFKFVMSIFWRTLVINLDREVYIESSSRKEMILCEKALSDFLLKDIYPTDFDNIYIGITPYIPDPQEEQKKLYYYFTRTTDVQIFFDNDDDVAFFYCIIPFFIFIGNIKGLNADDFINSRINFEGGEFKKNEMAINNSQTIQYINSTMSRITESHISQFWKM